MDSNQRKKTGTPFEYFLYTAIIVETALAATVYKVIFRSAELARLSLYFAIFYFAFLAWAIAQLHMLHRARNVMSAQLELPAEDSAPSAKETESDPSGATAEDTRPALGLTGGQLAIVIVVFATAIATFSWAMRLLR
jgi:hypothetical protein